MDITITKKLTGAEAEKLFDNLDTKDKVYVKFMKNLTCESDEKYNDEEVYKYEITFRCIEEKNIEEFIKSVKGAKPKMRKEALKQIKELMNNDLDLLKIEEKPLEYIKIYLKKLQEFKPGRKLIITAPYGQIYEDIIKEKKYTSAGDFYFLENTLCAVHLDNIKFKL